MENNVEAQKAQVTMTVQITRNETGITEEYNLVGVAEMADVIEAGILESNEVKEQ